MLLFDDPHQPWQRLDQPNGHLLYKGSREFAEGVLTVYTATNGEDVASHILAHLKSVVHFSSGVLETDTHILVWTDHIRSWPIFYTIQENDVVIGTNARQVRAYTKLEDVDEGSVVEFATSGFIAGSNTIYKDLRCIQPGEFIVYDKRHHVLTAHCYFSYVPSTTNTAPQDEKISQLGDIIDELITEIIARANGRTIWVPLSAGLDSRIILCKLHEHGYPNIQTFTYGPKHNFEALFAKKIADKLGVPWRMVSLSRQKIRLLLESKKRKVYWDYADNLKAIPSMNGLAAMLYLADEGVFKKGDVFINGQSGDYITGGHIFSSWIDDQKPIGRADFVDAIMGKHYSLWLSFKHKPELAIIKNRIAALIDPAWEEKDNFKDRASQLEQWEYDGRQICYVVNGQRIYDFLGYDWELPLWDKRLVDFCKTLTLDDKKDQALYKAYLKQYNYHGLFPEKEPQIWRWPLPMMWVIPCAQILQLFGLKSSFYALMRYFGHYGDQYCVFSFKDHVATHQRTRNVVSLCVRTWLLDHSAIIPEDVLRKVR